MAPLTPRQSAFVAEYLVDLNGTKAAIRAGYAAKTASRQAVHLFTKSHVAAAVTEAVARRAARVEVTADYVLRNLTQVVERCMQRAPVMTRRGGNPVQVQDDAGRDVWQFDAKGANGALNLLGQHLGLYTKKVEHSGDVKTGGVLVVPGMHPIALWADATQTQQHDLEAAKRALAEAHGVG